MDSSVFAKEHGAGSPRGRRASVGAALAPLAVIVAVAVTVNVGGPAKESASSMPEQSAERSDAAARNDAAVGDFIQSVALSHVARPRPYVETQPEKPVAAAVESAPAQKESPQKAAIVRPTGKRVEVAVLPPPLPLHEQAPTQPAATTPAEPPSFTRRTFGFDLPRLPDVASLAPSPKEVGAKAAELARDVGASIANLF
jgi:hypothetical protein